MQDAITLKEVIERLDAGEICSLAIRTFNKREDTGGEYIRFDRCCKSKIEKNKPSGDGGGQRFRKDPRHYENSTRNIVVLPEGNIVKVHLRLIRRFNDKQVL